MEVIVFLGTTSFGSELGGGGDLFLAAAVWSRFSLNWEKLRSRSHDSNIRDYHFSYCIFIDCLE